MLLLREKREEPDTPVDFERERFAIALVPFWILCDPGARSVYFSAGIPYTPVQVTIPGLRDRSNDVFGSSNEDTAYP